MKHNAINILPFVIWGFLLAAPAFTKAQEFHSLQRFTAPHVKSKPTDMRQDLICDPCLYSESCESDYESGTFLAFLGIDGSKQPQDFGANANLGMAGSLSYSGPLLPSRNIGFQIGTRATFSGNAVQVYELLGESKDRSQSFNTVGVFQRLDNGISFGAAYDFLTQESFDNFSLGQWRVKASIDISPVDELGVTLNFSQRADTGMFNSIPVELEPVEQLHIYLLHQWQSGVQTSFWVGVADSHSEENVLTGTLPRKNESNFVWIRNSSAAKSMACDLWSNELGDAGRHGSR